MELGRAKENVVVRETSLRAQRSDYWGSKTVFWCLYFFQYDCSFEKRKHIMCGWGMGKGGLDMILHAVRAEIHSGLVDG